MDNANSPDLFVKMVIAEWNKQNTNFTKLVDALGEQRLLDEIAPGKNTGIYLLGHLVAISDAMLPLLGMGSKHYPEMEATFVKSPDKSGLAMPSSNELRKRLDVVNNDLNTKINDTPTAGWFERHMSVSADDFAKEPSRNKLNVVLNRSAHLAYHLGQLALLK